MDSGAGAQADKQRLRAALRAVRRERSTDALESARRVVADRAVAAAVASHWACVAAYEPMRTEPGSVDLLSRLAALGVEVIVPLTLPDRDLDWRPWSPHEDANAIGNERQTLGVDAISRADAVLVPALAVGRDGTRLGRGCGSYDRALARCSPDVRSIALVFDAEVLDTVPVQSWDLPVQSAITPSGHIELDNAASGNTAVASGD